jgi:hypothetical protein
MLRLAVKRRIFLFKEREGVRVIEKGDWSEGIGD